MDRFRVMKRFGSDDESIKQVYLVTDELDPSKSLRVLKVYTQIEYEDFKNESYHNQGLQDSPFLIKAIGYGVSTSNSHPVTLKNGFKFRDYCYMVFDYCPMGTLGDFLTKVRNSGNKITIETQRYLFRQIINAVFVLQEGNKKCHLDLKPANIVFNNYMGLSLIDFGLATDLNLMLN